jgi:hypothetical protein
MATTASTLISSAFGLIGVYQPNESVSATDGQDALRRLNMLMGQLSLQPQSIPCRIREVFDMTAGKGSPTNPYTIGPTGNLVTTRPNVIEGAAVLLTAATPDPVEVPLAILTNDAYDAIQVKDLSNAQPTALFYQPTYASGLGKIFLWPVPDIATNDLVIYRLSQIAEFTTLAASVDLPAGADELLVYALAMRLCAPYGKICPPDVMVIGQNAMRTFKRGNNKLADMPQEILTGNREYGYNIVSGSGGN